MSKSLLRFSYFRQNWGKIDKNGLKSQKNARKTENGFLRNLDCVQDSPSFL